jgi:hypothetical protein
MSRILSRVLPIGLLTQPLDGEGVCGRWRVQVVPSSIPIARANSRNVEYVLDPETNTRERFLGCFGEVEAGWDGDGRGFDRGRSLGGRCRSHSPSRSRSL